MPRIFTFTGIPEVVIAACAAIAFWCIIIICAICWKLRRGHKESKDKRIVKVVQVKPRGRSLLDSDEDMVQRYNAFGIVAEPVQLEAKERIPRSQNSFEKLYEDPLYAPEDRFVPENGLKSCEESDDVKFEYINEDNSARNEDSYETFDQLSYDSVIQKPCVVFSLNYLEHLAEFSICIHSISNLLENYNKLSNVYIKIFLLPRSQNIGETRRACVSFINVYNETFTVVNISFRELERSTLRIVICTNNKGTDRVLCDTFVVCTTVDWRHNGPIQFERKLHPTKHSKVRLSILTILRSTCNQTAS